MQDKRSQVPFFNTQYPTVSRMNQQQLDFYNVWKREVERENYLDIDGNLGYFFVYLYSLSTWEHFDEILHKLLWLQRHYGEYLKVDEYCKLWIVDCYIAMKEFKKAIPYSPYNFNLIKNAGEKYFLEHAIKANFASKFTDSGRKHPDEVDAEILTVYQNIEREKPIDIIAECTRIIPNYTYFLFPGVPHIPTKNENGEIDLGVAPGPHSILTPFGLLPSSVKITFYDFDSEKFIAYAPDVRKLAEKTIANKFKNITFDHSSNKWLSHHPISERNVKEVFSYEGHYLDELAESRYPLDKHDWLNKLVTLYYVHRTHLGFIDKAIEYGIRDIEIFKPCMDQFKGRDFKHLTSELGKSLRDPMSLNPERNLIYSFVGTVKKLSIIYEKTIRYQEAIEVCKMAISMGIGDDVAKASFEKKIVLLKKKL